jgi:hypothetical protein
VKRLGRTRQHWEHYLAVLNLSNEALSLALRHRLPEGALREAAAEQDPARQLALVKAAVKRRQREQAEDETEAKSARPTKEAGRDNATIFRRKFVSGLRGFGRAFESLDGAKVNARALVRELSQDEYFGEIAATARQLLPVLEAVAKAKPVKAGKSKGKGA